MPPAPIVHHQGRFLDHADASFLIEDRGVLFADGVYEVVRFDRGRGFAIEEHVQRLDRSLDGIGLTGVEASALADLSMELMHRNGLTDAKVYWQVTRGPATRDFVQPATPAPTVTLMAYPLPPLAPNAEPGEGSAIVVDDCRWTRCHIKSLMLLPASQAKTAAADAGAVEAIFERAKPGAPDRHITEGASTNVFIVEDATLRTHPDDGWVLGGITRKVILRLARSMGLMVNDTEPFTRERFLAADEVFVCSTTQLTAITGIEGQRIGSGGIGQVTRRLHAAYRDEILRVNW
jgi:D-alanine transaminase